MLENNGRGKNRFETFFSHKDIRKLRNLVGCEAEQYIKHRVERNETIVLICPVCPDYPHDGKRFTYDKSKKVGESYSPNTPNLLLFLKKLEAVLPPKLCKVKILVCDIEGDLDNVSVNYSDDNFEELVYNTSIHTQNYILNKSDLEIETTTFFNFSKGKENFSKFQNYAREMTCSEFERELLKKIALERSSGMFKKLYGANTEEECLNLASRQRVNYYALAKCIDEQVGNCLVLNSPSPNLKYVKSTSVLKNKLQTSNNIIFLEI